VDDGRGGFPLARGGLLAVLWSIEDKASSVVGGTATAALVLDGEGAGALAIGFTFAGTSDTQLVSTADLTNRCTSSASSAPVPRETLPDRSSTNSLYALPVSSLSDSAVAEAASPLPSNSAASSSSRRLRLSDCGRWGEPGGLDLDPVPFDGFLLLLLGLRFADDFLDEFLAFPEAFATNYSSDRLADFLLPVEVFPFTTNRADDLEERPTERRLREPFASLDSDVNCTLALDGDACCLEDGSDPDDGDRTSATPSLGERGGRLAAKSSPRLSLDAPYIFAIDATERLRGDAATFVRMALRAAGAAAFDLPTPSGWDVFITPRRALRPRLPLICSVFAGDIAPWDDCSRFADRRLMARLRR